MAKKYEKAINNIIYFVGHLKTKSNIIQGKFDHHELEIYGALYHLEDGKIQIIEDEVKK